MSKVKEPCDLGEMMDTRPVYNQHDGLTGRDGGPYLDQVEAYNAEIARARVEGREPDFENLSSTAGVPLVPAAILKNSVGVNSVPSQGDVDSNALAVTAMVDDENVLLESKGEAVFPEPVDAFTLMADGTPAENNEETADETEPEF